MADPVPLPDLGQTADGAANPGFEQEHEEVVLNKTWWWAVQLSLSVVALVANFIFLITIIYNRYDNNKRSRSKIRARCCAV